MSHIFALSGDIFAMMLIWRARKLVLQKQQKMFETESDAKLRKILGVLLILVGLLGIFADHFLFNF